jgi:PIN domain nuclease of toxin-antitoxin system
MIVVDTHIWLWWVHGDPRLSPAQAATISAQESQSIGVSAISCWEIAKLVEYGRLELPCSLLDWFDQALRYPGVRILELTPAIAVESTQLPGHFHRDPAD